MGQKNGANYVVLYQMLCLMTINTNGRLSRQIGEVIIPYDVDKIQRDTKWFSADTVRVALGLYAKLGLIYQEQDGTLVLANHLLQIPLGNGRLSWRPPRWLKSSIIEGRCVSMKAVLLSANPTWRNQDKDPQKEAKECLKYVR